MPIKTVTHFVTFASLVTLATLASAVSGMRKGDHVSPCDVLSEAKTMPACSLHGSTSSEKDICAREHDEEGS
jgi:hypothetical protein